jgi:hypothetical protein
MRRRRPTLPSRAAAVVCLALAFAVLAGWPAFAQIREGIYVVEGQNPDGTTYTGQLALRAAPGASWLAVWQVGGEQVAGLGLIQAGVLAISFIVGGRPGIAAFEVQPNGTLAGSWTTGGGIGTEVLTPR